MLEYREAVTADPDSPQLKGKLEVARREAIGASVRKADACVAGADFECAVRECDYVISLDPGNAQAARLRFEAAKAVAAKYLASARSFAARRQAREGFNALAIAAKASSSPELAAGMNEVRGALVEVAVGTAQEARGAKQYPEAIGLLELASASDGARAPLLAEVRAEYEAYRAEQYDVACARGDAALTSRQWAIAAQSYQAALGWQSGGRAGPLARYALALDRADGALRRRDFVLAAAAYREGVSSGADSSGYAASQLDAVEVRPYSVRLRTLLVKPLSPEGRPWVGPPSPMLGLAFKAIAGYALPVAGAYLADKVIDAAEKVPPENRPLLWVEVELPDGRRLTTPKRKALYAVFDSSFVVATNQFDERQLRVRVFGEGDRHEDVGAFDVTLKDLVRLKEFTGASQSVQGLQLLLNTAETQVDGESTEMTVTPNQGNSASAWSQSLPGRTGYRLVEISTSLVLGDYQNEFGMDGAPDPRVEIEQGGRIVYSSPKVPDSNRATWSPGSTYLFVEPGEKLGVRVWDVDASDDDLAINGVFSGRDLASGTVRIGTQLGSVVELRFEQRRVGP